MIRTVVGLLLLLVTMSACSDAESGDARVSVAVSALDVNDVTQVSIGVSGPGMAMRGRERDDRVLQGNGSGGFTAGKNVPVGTGQVCVATGDFEADGKLDVAVVRSSSRVSIRLGQ